MQCNQFNACSIWYHWVIGEMTCTGSTGSALAPVVMSKWYPTLHQCCLFKGTCGSRGLLKHNKLNHAGMLLPIIMCYWQCVVTGHPKHSALETTCLCWPPCSLAPWIQVHFCIFGHKIRKLWRGESVCLPSTIMPKKPSNPAKTWLHWGGIVQLIQIWQRF